MYDVLDTALSETRIMIVSYQKKEKCIIHRRYIADVLNSAPGYENFI
jgi:hypothetical protein